MVSMPCAYRPIVPTAPPVYISLLSSSFFLFFVLERNYESCRGRSARSERFGTILPRFARYDPCSSEDSRKIYISYVLRALGIRRITIYPTSGSSSSDLSYRRRFLFFFFGESTRMHGSNRAPDLEHCRTICRRNSTREALTGHAAVCCRHSTANYISLYIV